MTFYCPVTADVIADPDKGPGIMCIDYRVPGFPCRSTVVQVAGGWVIYNPPIITEHILTGLQQLGECKAIICASNFHTFGLASTIAAFAGTPVYAGRASIKRLKKKGIAARSDLSALREFLPQGLVLDEVPHVKYGELWMRHTNSDNFVTWTVCDSFFNFRSVPKSLPLRAYFRLAKAGPGLAISGLVKLAGISNRKLYKEWLLDQLDADHPQVVVPAHGLIERQKVTEQIRALVQERL